MFDPTPPKRRVSLTEILTVDNLINLISSKARTRRGRIVVGASSLVLLAAIIFAPIVIRSNHSGAGTSSTPTIPVVTVPPNTNTRTAFVAPFVPVVDTNLNDRNRYGAAPRTATTAPAPPPTTVPPTTVPPVTAPPVTTPATFPTVTFPTATFPPPVTSPPPPPPTPLTVPGGPIQTP